MSKNALPAAALVSIGCSVAFRLAPSARRVLTMSCRSIHYVLRLLVYVLTGE
jgi:hypothetical protein